jgi:transposase InsO family protein
LDPPSLKGYHFMLVATDYFTNWTKVFPLKNMTLKEVIEFIIEDIIHRFSIPQTSMTDQGTLFVSGQVWEFIESYKMKLINSSPYYAQDNAQAESSNKTLIKLIKKKIIEDTPRRWHEVLFEALWAHRISRYGTTKVTPFELIYGQEVILPIEVNLAAYRLAKRNELFPTDYHNLMMNNNDEVTDKRLQALKKIEKDKIRVARAYNKKVT